MADRTGIEIDYCPDCRGVWLDRGELDKIIERATPTQAAQPASRAPLPAPAPAPAQPRRKDDYDDDDDDRRRYQPSTTSDGRPMIKKKRGGILGDIFDF